MPAYNVEIFTPDIVYRDSIQIKELDCEIDYLDVVKNKIEFGKRKIEAQKGDYIRIRNRSFEVLGIVSDIVEEKNKYSIEYKNLNKLWDQDVFVDFELLEEKSLEEWIAWIIRGLYIDSGDLLQDIFGMTVTTTSSTNAVFSEDYKTGIHNFFEIIIEAFTQYGVLVTESMDVGNKRIEVAVGKCREKEFTIEADLNNILDKEIIIKESKESVNKLIIYNQEDYAQHVTYYMDADERITTDDSNRKKPVVLDCVAVKATDKTPFEQQAEKKAGTVLKVSKLNNHIEIKVTGDDRLVRPRERKIGQQAAIISCGEVYKTVLTGMEIDEKVNLIFGVIRLELTKQIKRRWRKNEY